MAKIRKHAELLRIGQVASLVGVSAQSVRNWEAVGLVKAVRTETKHRLYTRETVNQLKQVKFLKRIKGLNAAGILQLRRERAGVDSVVPELPPRSADLATRFAKLRRDNAHTLNQVAQKTGLSTSYLSAIERGHANPSVAALQKLAEAYKTNVVSFFDVDFDQRKLVRPKDRRRLSSEPGVQMELLAFGPTQMEAMLFRIAPRTSSGGAYHHQGEEFIYMLQGKLEIWLDEIERYVLSPGDSLYFKSTQSHRWCSLTDRECVLLWLNTPPTF